MSLIDLHVHSTASDGTFSPGEVTALAAEAGLSAIALTDHDTVDGVPQALEAAKRLSIQVIPGAELSAQWHGKEIHILGLFLRWDSPDLLSALKELRQKREERNDEIIRRLGKAGFSITKEELQAGSPDTVITRAHFARVMTEKGYTASRKEAFSRYLKPGGPYCPPKEQLFPETALSLILEAGGFAALAHPLQYGFSNQELEELTGYLSGLGMKGLEVYHSSNNSYESRKLKELAVRHHLLPTGGSDFHGDNKPDIRIGCGRGNLRVSSLLLDDILRSREQASDPA